MSYKMPKLLLTGAASLLLTACSALPGSKPIELNSYTLDALPAITKSEHRSEQTLLVTLPRAQAGYDTPRMAYVQRAHALSYFAKHRWADAPSRMLATLMVQTLENSGQFHAVALAPSPASADLRLDTELVALHHDFTQQPSRAVITLRAQLIDRSTGEIVATRLFNQSEASDSETPYGGVAATNRAVKRVLVELAEFCSQP